MTEIPTKKIVLVVSEGRQSTEAFHFCLHRAKEAGRKLAVVCVANGNGASPEWSQKILGEAARQCRTFQVPFETQTQSGDYADVCQQLSSECDTALLVVTKKKRSFIKKWVEGSESFRLKDRVSCELKTYEAD